MASYIGDYSTTETVVIPVNTFSSDDPSASVTAANFTAASIAIHKDGSTTQRSSSSGVTVAVDFDGVTGNHVVSIDLSDNADAGFYVDGSRYQVRMEAVTVDGGAVNAWIGTFSIGCTLRPTTNGRRLDVSANGNAGIDWGNIENPTSTQDLSGTTVQAVTDQVDANVTQVSGDTTAADNLEATFDGTGYAFPNSVLPWNPAWDAEVQSEVVDGLTQYGASQLVATDIVSAGAALSTTLTGKLLEVGTVDTCTVNTDMRGTDNAALAIALASTDSAIAVVDGVADDIKAVTDQMRFTVANQIDANALSGGGSGGDDDAATIYTYFTSAGRQETFRADTNGLASSVDLAIVDANVDTILTSVTLTVPGLINIVDAVADQILGHTTDMDNWWQDGGRLDAILDATSTSAEVAAINQADTVIVAADGDYIKGRPYQLVVTMLDSAGNEIVDPVFVAGDVKVLIGSSYQPVTTLPIVSPAGSGRSVLTLSTQETNQDTISLRYYFDAGEHDAADEEWMPVAVELAAQNVNVAATVQATTAPVYVAPVQKVVLPQQEIRLSLGDGTPAPVIRWVSPVDVLNQPIDLTEVECVVKVETTDTGTDLITIPDADLIKEATRIGIPFTTAVTGEERDNAAWSLRRLDTNEQQIGGKLTVQYAAN